MGRLVFQPASPSLVQDYDDVRQVSVYPTLARQHIFILGITSAHPYDITDMMGRIVTSGMIRPDSSIPLGELNPGGYILMIKGKNSLVYSGRFFKAE
jgi:hypothetical protein